MNPRQMGRVQENKKKYFDQDSFVLENKKILLGKQERFKCGGMGESFQSLGENKLIRAAPSSLLGASKRSCFSSLSSLLCLPGSSSSCRRGHPDSPRGKTDKRGNDVQVVGDLSFHFLHSSNRKLVLRLLYEDMRQCTK